jgi:hypothetical protein
MTDENEYDNVDEATEDTHEVAEEDRQVNDPDVDTRPAEPVQHTSNVVGRRNPDLPTEVVGQRGQTS